MANPGSSGARTGSLLLPALRAEKKGDGDPTRALADRPADGRAGASKAEAAMVAIWAGIAASGSVTPRVPALGQLLLRRLGIADPQLDRRPGREGKRRRSSRRGGSDALVARCHRSARTTRGARAPVLHRAPRSSGRLPPARTVVVAAAVVAATTTARSCQGRRPFFSPGQLPVSGKRTRSRGPPPPHEPGAPQQRRG